MLLGAINEWYDDDLDTGNGNQHASDKRILTLQ